MKNVRDIPTHIHGAGHEGESLEVVIRWGLLALCVFAMLAHGVVEPWSILLFQVFVTALFLLWVFKFYRERKLEIFIPQLAWPLLGLIILGCLQALAWFDDAGVRRSLSYDVEATRNTVMMLLSLLVCLLLAANFLNRREDIEKLATLLPLYGMGLATLAILQHFTAPKTILWLRDVAPMSPFGTFINRDHFAGYMELLIGLPLALIATQYIRGERRFLYAVAAILMGVAVILTLSRGGTISILVGMLFVAVMSARRARLLRRETRGGLFGLVTVGIILSAILAGIIWIGAEPVINRFATGNPDSSDLSKAQTFENARGTIWRDSWLIFKANPLLGVGLGGYETAYHTFGLDDERGGIVAQAHNDYLQVLADTGIVGGLLLFWFLVVLLRNLLANIKRRDPLLAGVALGSSAGVLAILVHSFFDFNLQLVSHALLFLVLSTVVSRVRELAEEPARATIEAPLTATPLISEVSL